MVLEFYSSQSDCANHSLYSSYQLSLFIFALSELNKKFSSEERNDLFIFHMYINIVIILFC